jgi:hypothetical protein
MLVAQAVTGTRCIDDIKFTLGCMAFANNARISVVGLDLCLIPPASLAPSKSCSIFHRSSKGIRNASDVLFAAALEHYMLAYAVPLKSAVIVLRLRHRYMYRVHR